MFTTLYPVPVYTVATAPCSEDCACTKHAVEVCAICGCDWFRFGRAWLECGFCSAPHLFDTTV